MMPCFSLAHGKCPSHFVHSPILTVRSTRPSPRIVNLTKSKQVSLESSLVRCSFADLTMNLSANTLSESFAMKTSSVCDWLSRNERTELLAGGSTSRSEGDSTNCRLLIAFLNGLYFASIETLSNLGVAPSAAITSQANSKKNDMIRCIFRIGSHYRRMTGFTGIAKLTSRPWVEIASLSICPWRLHTGNRCIPQGKAHCRRRFLRAAER